MTEALEIGKRSRSATRESLLNAAGEVVLRLGADALTLDAVAKEAGVSKGGLLYHFPNKDALLTSMVANLIAEFEQLLEIELNREGDLTIKGSWLRAYIRAGDIFDRQNAAIQSGLLAAFTKDSKLLQPYQEASIRWHQQACNCGLAPLKVGIILLAADGLSWNQLLGLNCISDDQRSQLIEELIRMTYTDE
ncbi:TetR/AcrR family transcriptional regulator [Pseudanabaena sp. FACHB-1998]|uniref:TetR/AcrR family transcriptional regulator n=1 Tax=Pseudanabaena sp. FACHB-1998 TaxID=2692858 RepID=UPI0016807188|nr:TetR/AcrR family transcriptional regulator [Pseudanabaena sp. FACHB-1998]MBD2176402.1 TetR/AcrR family transcriptional regulator [Pseudanabaena sp. FACHB-1998]